jgi:hypothetical protein
MIETICRQYATAVAQSGMPANLMFNQCMTQRHCQVSVGSSRYHCEMPGPMIIRPVDEIEAFRRLGRPIDTLTRGPGPINSLRHAPIGCLDTHQPDDK